MTFRDRYQKSKTWHERAIVMEIFHLAMISNSSGWTISKTADHFQCSIGLVSENLKLAHAIHHNPKILETPTRQDALRRLNG